MCPLGTILQRRRGPIRLEKNMRKAYYIASTHWDREWYETFQRFRWRLVHLLDEVFKVLETDSEFSSFEMDGQVIPVADYLEVRTDARAQIIRLATAGKFRLGPWLVLPDEWLVSGESLIRNLELGLKLTEEFSSPRPLTAPLIDQFGHVSQMPQILAQFGFVGTFLHRGINLADCTTNFNWISPDGSSVICHRLAKQGYGTFQIFYRRVLEGDEPFDFNGAVDRLVEWTLAEAKRTNDSPILLLDSCDHVEIEPQVPNLIAAANSRLREHGIEVHHSDSDAYIKQLSEHVAWGQETDWKGELRMSARDHSDVDAAWLISGVLSSRVQLKQSNAQCEDELCLWAEPFASFAAHSLDVLYPAEFLTLAWRHLLENHAHDSICGCSIDQVHKDMEYRFDQSFGISRKVTETSFRAIALASAPTNLGKDALTVTLFNATAQNRDEPTDVQIRLPSSWPEKFQEFFGYEEKFSFRITDPEGREIPWQLNGQERDHIGFRRPYRKIPVADTRNIVDITISTLIPAFGYTTLVVEPVPGPKRYLGTQRFGDRAMQNEFLFVEVEPNGTVTLLDKVTQTTFRGLFFYEDSADIGDGWNWCPPVNNSVATSAGSNWSLSVLADGPEKTTFQITTRLRVAESFDFKTMRRNIQEGELTIINQLTLRRGARVLESQIEVINTVKDHRLRVLFPTDLKAKTYFSDSAFDAVERPISLAENNELRRELDVDGRPQQSWTALSDGDQGLAVVSRGLYESGVANRSDHPLFLTLLRGFRKAVFSNDNPGGQSSGHHTFRINLIPFSGKVLAKNLHISGQLIVSNNRFVDLLPQELIPSSELPPLPRRHAFFEVTGDIVITSIQSEESKRLTVRFFNPSIEPVTFAIGKPGQFGQAETLNLAGEYDPQLELELKDGVVTGTLGGKRIATLKLVPAAIPSADLTSAFNYEHSNSSSDAVVTA